MRVRWGLFDVSAKDDAVLSSSPMQPFGSLADLKNDTTKQFKYVTLEEDQTLLDGSFIPMPKNPKNMGYWSKHMSGADGTFRESERPWIQIDFQKEDHSSTGITLEFHELYGDYPGETVFTWYDDQGSVITFGHFFPDKPKYFFARNSENYRKILIGFLGTSKPYRFIKVAKIDYGTLNEIQDENVISATITEELNPISAELRINTLQLKFYSDSTDFSALNPEGIYKFLQQRQLLEVEEFINGERIPMGGFYLESWDDATDNTVSLTAIDLVGVISKTDFPGGMYKNIRAGELIRQIMASADAKYTLDPSLSDIPRSGHLPILSHREALQQVCFSIGAAVDCSRDKVINIYPQVEEMTSIIGTERKFIGQKTSLSDLVTGIQTTMHNYTETSEPIELFSGELEAGTHEIIFSEPAHSVTVSGASKVAETVNAVTISVSATRNVVVAGKKYMDNQQIVSKSMTKAASNSAPNVYKVEAATLIGSDNAVKITSAVFNYYQNRYKLEFKFIPDGERVGDLVMVETVGGGRLRGWIEQMKYDLTGGFLVSCVVVGNPIEIRHHYYMGEIYMGDEFGVM